MSDKATRSAKTRRQESAGGGNSASGFLGTTIACIRDSVLGIGDWKADVVGLEADVVVGTAGAMARLGSITACKRDSEVGIGIDGSEIADPEILGASEAARSSVLAAGASKAA